MQSTVTAPHPAHGWSVALVGNPNCGKTALFNLLTGARQKVANYAGVTVERKVGTARLRNGQSVSVIDLPGAYSLTPVTPDEQVTLEVIEGRRAGEATPDVIVAVVDATNLRMNLRLVLKLKRLGRPMMVALNMADVARSQGLAIDVPKLSAELGCPVVETVAVKHDGHAGLLALLEARLGGGLPAPQATAALPPAHSTAELQREVRRILAITAPKAGQFQRFHHRIDAVVMHPVWGLVLLAAVLFLIFQAVFSWATVPMDFIKETMAGPGRLDHRAPGGRPAAQPAGRRRHRRRRRGDRLPAADPDPVPLHPRARGTGYMPRAAFLMDQLMGKVGLSGRAFIPLLSSFACAIPGIMATRTIADAKDRLATILIAPLMTCSARLPVYALMIGAFVPNRSVGVFNLRGLTLFGLYIAGVASAMGVAWVFKRVWMKSRYQPLMLELPPYRLPGLRNLGLGLWERVAIFMRRVGGIIFSLMVVLWFLSSYPAPPDGATGPAIQYSIAGWLGQMLQHVFAPIGFNWPISIALVPGLAAREVAVGALGTVYSMSAAGDSVADALSPVIAGGWSLATAYSLLAWYVFAPQCISTLAVVKRETNSWRYPLLMAVYLFVLAYVAAFVTYRVTLWLGA